jgi:hypothetical protein
LTEEQSLIEARRGDQGTRQAAGLVQAFSLRPPISLPSTALNALTTAPKLRTSTSADAIAVRLRRTGRVEHANGSLKRAGPRAEVDGAPVRSCPGQVEESVRCRRRNRFDAVARLDHLPAVSSIPPRLTRSEPSATNVARLVSSMHAQGCAEVVHIDKRSPAPSVGRRDAPRKVRRREFCPGCANLGAD